MVDWSVDDPGLVGGRIAAKLRLPRPDPDADSLELELIGGWLRLRRPGTGAGERLEVARTDQGIPAHLGGPSPRVGLLGIGWATVDRERAAPAVAGDLGFDVGAFEAADDDAWLGARAVTAPVDDTAIVLLEPSTEGRLAAALAKFGEGPIALYLGLPGPAAGATRPGPLGPGALVLGSRPWGPFVLAVPVEAAG